MMKNKLTIPLISACLIISGGLAVLSGCDNYYKDDYVDNSPTSGKLKVFCSEGLVTHVQNQAFTFCAQYSRATVEVVAMNEKDAIDLLLKDSCKSIIITRLLGNTEKQAFSEKQLNPGYSPIAKTGIALITNTATPIDRMTIDQVKELLKNEITLKDSLGRSISPVAVLDNKNSSVCNFLLDSLIQKVKFGPKCFALENTLALIKQISETPNQIGFIDFAWLSDVDDSLFKQVKDKIKFIPLAASGHIYYAPNQSSFKTGTYPLTRTVYFLRRTDDFSLAKGFESFLAGPKGQLTFLKQGLLPIRQAERNIEVKMEPMNTQ
ncbi:MAG: substrate-binding domain-containing protein [Bacteroidetes bacterium]|nr:substrate-binding domain-containing protein [Bacteroidota bacterium]